MTNPEALQHLLDELARMPGVGPKSAQRIAYWILGSDTENIRTLSRSIIDAKEAIHFCERCFNFAQDELCEVCSFNGRDESKICVVEEPRDVNAIEKTNEFRGYYHVLHGALSPMDGIGPEQLKIQELIARLGSGEVQEVILATNPNVEGETTASYLSRLIKPLGITVSRIASGLPVGGDLEYADEVTLGRALEARREM